jgi:CRP-like cAMP-binding protein
MTLVATRAAVLPEADGAARPGPGSNRMLASLSPRDWALLAPHLEPVTLQREQVLANAGDIVTYVVFPEQSTAVALFATMGDGRVAEVGLVGRNSGAVGLVSTGGDGRALCRATVVIAGPAMRIPAVQLAAAAKRSAGLRLLLARQAELTLGQTMQVAACNALHSVERRICRWILTVHDCVRDGAPGNDDAPLPLTQELVGDALGVQRTTVTVVAMRLQQAGLVRYGRGRLFVLNRPGLEQASCECHGALRRLQNRLQAEPVEA